MLNSDTFMQWIRLLSEFFQKPLSNELVEVIYNELSPHLSDEQFERSVRLAIRYESRFPTLERLIRFGKATGERRADLERFQPDITAYDPSTPEVRAARAEVLQQLDALKARRSSAAQSGLTTLGDTLSGVLLGGEQRKGDQPRVVRRPK